MTMCFSSSLHRWRLSGKDITAKAQRSQRCAELAVAQVLS
jgi:hypothetical protein